jgi:hypothetical protein
MKPQCKLQGDYFQRRTGRGQVDFTVKLSQLALNTEEGRPSADSAANQAKRNRRANRGSVSCRLKEIAIAAVAAGDQVVLTGMLKPAVAYSKAIAEYLHTKKFIALLTGGNG